MQLEYFLLHAFFLYPSVFFSLPLIVIGFWFFSVLQWVPKQ